MPRRFRDGYEGQRYRKSLSQTGLCSLCAPDLQLFVPATEEPKARSRKQPRRHPKSLLVGSRIKCQKNSRKAPQAAFFWSAANGGLRDGGLRLNFKQIQGHLRKKAFVQSFLEFPVEKGGKSRFPGREARYSLSPFWISLFAAVFLICPLAPP